MASQSSVAVQKHVRILALDAGGVKCLSSLRILQEIMQRVAPKGTSLIDLPKPCAHFDLICGSEYGAVLALMLGRLKMSVYECYDWFKRLGLPEYSTVAGLLPEFLLNKTENFAKTFGKLLESRGLSESELLFESAESSTSAPACKTFVLVIDLESIRSPVRLRTYVSKSDGQAMISSCSIMQAAMAAITIPLKHKPLNIDKMWCISASAAGFSNPSREAYDEGTRIWSPEAIHTIVSLGTGRKLLPSLSGNVGDKFYQVFGVISLLKEVAANPERVSDELYRDARINGFHCSRFTINPVLIPISSTSWSQGTYEKIEEATKMYIGSEVAQSSFKGCARNISPTGFAQSPELTQSRYKSPLRTYIEAQERRQDQENVSLIANQVPADLTVIGGNHLAVPNVPSRMVFSLFDCKSCCSDSENYEASDFWIQDFRQNTSETFPAPLPDDLKKVKIAIIDTGLDGGHPSVAGEWTNPNSHNRYKDFFTGDSSDTDPKDTCGHGTYVAGIILQLAPDAELYIARVFGNGSAEEFQDQSAKERVAQAINYATDVWNVDVISMSFGFDRQMPEIRAAVTHAYDKGIVMIAAASNNGNRKLIHIAYPASHLGHVICMNSADSYGARSIPNPPPAGNRDNFSILGENVKSIWPANLRDPYTFEDANRTWRRMSGTSVATPIAAALASLLIQYKRVHFRRIENHERLESFEGITRIFINMSMGRKFEGFDNILPAAIFGPESRNIMPFIMSQEMKKI